MRRPLLTALLAALALAAACDDGLGPDSDEAGRYELVSVNGRPLPTPFFSVEVLSASVTLKPDRSYETASTIRGKDNLGVVVVQSDSESGTYTRIENTIQLTSTRGNVTTGTYSGRAFTVNADTVEMVYRRR